MAPVEKQRWALLWGASACGLLLFCSPMIPLPQLIPINPDFITFPVAIGAIGFQALGTIGMRLHLRALSRKAPFITTASFIAALAWGIAVLAALWGVASGPGGIVVGLLVMLPAAVLALALQVLALIAFHRAERRT